MSQVNVVRAWKDEEYRRGLTEAERASLPENPAEFFEQTEAQMEQTVGGGFQLNTLYCNYELNPAIYSIGGCPSVQCNWCLTRGIVEYGGPV
jgi:mersacidin/lichenicidin family type 2 lantibiotic